MITVFGWILLVFYGASTALYGYIYTKTKDKTIVISLLTGLLLMVGIVLFGTGHGAL